LYSYSDEGGAGLKSDVTVHGLAGKIGFKQIAFCPSDNIHTDNVDIGCREHLLFVVDHSRPFLLPVESLIIKIDFGTFDNANVST
ncbi:MAG: hypothetical protein WBW71_00045, partial [Bacteroidota bacterium]